MIDARRDIQREDRMERNERPQRPDSRDSRASRESKTSVRDDDSHKLRDCCSWVNEVADYEENKRDAYHEDIRERERERGERRQPLGPVTKERIEADELKGEKRNLTQLKRASADQDKKDQAKESISSTMDQPKKEMDVWNRKIDRVNESVSRIERGDNSPKAWADAVSPTFEKEEEKALEPIKSEKDTDESLKQNFEKLSLEKREDSLNEDAVASAAEGQQAKEDKREKNIRNRTNSGGSNSRVRDSRGGGGGRQWGSTYSVYARGWRGPETRGRRGGPRAAARPASARSGSYGHTDSENSADEVSGSTESGKEEKKSARSPKPNQKAEKEERNQREAMAPPGRDEKRADYAQSQRSEKRTSYDSKVNREGFAPSGEPSRRGRGSSFRIRSTTATSSRMEGYGPPSNKSPFSSERNVLDEKPNPAMRQNPSTPTPEKEMNSLLPSSLQAESADDKIIAKQQALTAGITGKRAKSPNQQSQSQQSQQQQSSSKQDANHASNNASSQKMMQVVRKEESRSKRTRSGSRRVSFSSSHPFSPLVFLTIYLTILTINNLISNVAHSDLHLTNSRSMFIG